MRDESVKEKEPGEQLQQLRRELDNFEDNFKYLLPQPGEIPRLTGIEVWGGTLPLWGTAGGDHIIYIDFKQRYDLQPRINRARATGCQGRGEP